MRNFDYVVVDGDSAGCVPVGRFSENPDVSVCLLEADGRDDSLLINVPMLAVSMLPTRIHNWAALGTCKMGPTSDPMAVVDDPRQVHNMEGLRVIDASIMPRLSSDNTNVPSS